MLQLLKGTQFELADYIKKNNYEVYIYGAWNDWQNCYSQFLHSIWD